MNTQSRGIAFKLVEHKIIWEWAAKHGWIAPIHWDHDIHDEVAGVSVNWNGLTDYALWKCGRSGDIVANDWVGTEVARGCLPGVLEAVAQSRRSGTSSNTVGSPHFP